ncbi:hypothetical protein [Sulfuriflexus sp.]|uniref:hypothetical protein n=1 Tax=Sulfuriflexus sp. TaxID=2015443 RepID=UPI0028CD1132|nr:hypothetical protein [Sulfuriflexus sp.]MDT8403858.1 hypothetical protein [Sulfuriflexus sp.]
MQRMRWSFIVAAFLSLMTLAGIVQAEDKWLYPYVLASETEGDVNTAAEQTKAALQANGFEVVGSYAPYADTVVIGATNEALKTAAAKTEFGGYGAVVRVAVTKVNGKVQVSFFNPDWMAAAYRMKTDLAPVRGDMEKALGMKQFFGSQDPGWKAGQLEDYHFMVFMPYFDDHHELAEHDSYTAAIKAVEANLAAGKGETTKVYRVDIPGKEQTVYGVAIGGAPAGDEHIMKLIDKAAIKQTAHLPYELLVSGNKVYALHAKFRIAVNFPDLDMGTFMHINDAPAAIETALGQVAAGE